MTRIIGSGVLLVVLVVLAAPAWAGFQEGLAAAKSGDYSTAMREWRPLAEQGNAGAQFNLGIMYEKGQGVLQNHAAAAHWYRKAAEQGHAKAQNNLGGLYGRGLGVLRDFVQAFSNFRD